MGRLYNLARVRTSTTGTGTITLGGAVTGFLTFAGAGVQNGDVVAYAIRDGSNSEAVAMPERCESYHTIDLAWLRRQKLLSPGLSSSIRWSRAGRHVGSVGIVARGNCVHLVYRLRAPGGEWQDAEEVVPFTETKTCFGGRRRWFACPTCGK